MPKIRSLGGDGTNLVRLVRAGLDLKLTRTTADTWLAANPKATAANVETFVQKWLTDRVTDVSIYIHVHSLSPLYVSILVTDPNETPLAVWWPT